MKAIKLNELKVNKRYWCIGGGCYVYFKRMVGKKYMFWDICDSQMILTEDEVLRNIRIR